jgi:hypothetical protein
MPAFRVVIDGDSSAAAQLVAAVTACEKTGPIVSVMRVDDSFVIVTEKKARAAATRKTGPQETR